MAKGEELSLEAQFQRYLKMVRITEEEMSPIQRKETRRAFFGACGQMLILFRDTIGGIEDENEAIDAMQDLINQVDIFWRKELGM